MTTFYPPPQSTKLIVITRAGVPDLMDEIKRQVGIYNNSKEVGAKSIIFSILSRVSEVFQFSGEDTLRNHLIELHKRDRKIWSGHLWEKIEWNKRSWHEESQVNAHQRIGISPDDIMGLPRSCPAGRIPLGGGFVQRKVENSRERALVAIYGADSKFLRALSNNS